jgi:hypothetical protein
MKIYLIIGDAKKFSCTFPRVTRQFNLEDIKRGAPN